MTLLLTEIHEEQERTIVFAADRRISRAGRPASRQKVFTVPQLRAGVGYFGLAEFPGGRVDKLLSSFIKNNRGTSSMAEFAGRLADSLNSDVPEAWRSSEPSGVHIAGFAPSGEIEFWFVRNVGDDRTTMIGRYEAREDYQRTHKAALQAGQFQVYRNGDLRAHVIAWERIDRALERFFGFPDFERITTRERYLAWVRFKFQVLCRFYEDFCTDPIIGLPVDAFAVTRTGYLNPPPVVGSAFSLAGIRALLGQILGQMPDPRS
jgi:hypothetical protein